MWPRRRRRRRNNILKRRKDISLSCLRDRRGRKRDGCCCYFIGIPLRFVVDAVFIATLVCTGISSPAHSYRFVAGQLDIHVRSTAAVTTTTHR